MRRFIYFFETINRTQMGNNPLGVSKKHDAFDVVREYPVEGFTIMITGCTSGHGKVVARALYQSGATIIMACRSPWKMRKVEQELLEWYPQSTGQIKMLTLDLASFQLIRDARDAFAEMGLRIDVLINNAGVWKMSRYMTVDGYEYHKGVNYLGTYLFTRLMEEFINDQGRIVIVASSFHVGGTLGYDRVLDPRPVPFLLKLPNFIKRFVVSFRLYGTSKLALRYFTEEYQRRLLRNGKKHITVMSLHPGMMDTPILDLDELDRTEKFFTYPGQWLGLLLGRGVTKGASTATLLAAHPYIGRDELYEGQYFSSNHIAHWFRDDLDPGVARALYDDTERVVGQWLNLPKVTLVFGFGDNILV